MNTSTFANTERLRSRAEALRILGLKAPHGDFHWAQELGAGGMTDTLVSSRSAAEGMHTHARREPGAELELDERWRHFLLGQKALMQKVADTGSEVDEEIIIAVQQARSRSLLIADLGWTPLQALEARGRLAAFEEDWDAPGMELYDEL